MTRSLCGDISPARERHVQTRVGDVQTCVDYVQTRVDDVEGCADVSDDVENVPSCTEDVVLVPTKPRTPVPIVDSSRRSTAQDRTAQYRTPLDMWGQNRTSQFTCDELNHLSCARAEFANGTINYSCSE